MSPIPKTITYYKQKLAMNRKLSHLVVGYFIESTTERKLVKQLKVNMNLFSALTINHGSTAFTNSIGKFLFIFPYTLIPYIIITDARYMYAMRPPIPAKDKKDTSFGIYRHMINTPTIGREYL